MREISSRAKTYFLYWNSISRKYRAGVWFAVSRKKGAAVAVIIVVVAAIGGFAAYSAMPRQQEDAGPEPVLTTIDRRNESDSDSSTTTIAENASGQQPQQQQQNNNTGTVIANNTVVINKPVYRNNTIIYQPVTINLENYRTTINHHIELENDDDSATKPADKSHSITIRAKRIQSEGWSEKFTDDGVGMFTAVYDINGNIIKTGYADERGFTVSGLEDKLYFVYPADCNDCGNSKKNDIVFMQWEDGSKNRPRLVPADSNVTASYGLVVPERPKQVPLIPPGETGTAAEPEMTLKAHNSTYIYGWVQVSVQLENKVESYDEILVSIYAPDGTLQDSFSYPEQQGFFASRETGEGDYRIVVTYEYDKGTARAEITHPIKFATPKFVNLSATEDNNTGTMRVDGMLEGGLAGENITIALNDPDDQTIKKYAMSFGTRPIFTLFIPGEEARAIFNETGNYTFVVTHLPTGVQGSVTLSHNNNANETEEASTTPMNVSGNAGRSERADMAVQGSDVYVVWQDDTSGHHEIMFAKSSDSGATFSEPVAIGRSEQGGSSLVPDIVVSGNSVYVVWADYNSQNQSAIALRSSNDSGKTFGDTLILGGNYTGENSDPHVAIFKGNIYVLWVAAGAVEGSAGDLMLARSSDGVEFEAAVVGSNATNPAMTSSDSALYLAWQQQLSGNATEGRGEGVNVFASSSDGTNFETAEMLPEMTIQTMAASADAVYIAGVTNNNTVTIARSNGSASFGDALEIGNGASSHVAASGAGVYVAWVQDGKVLLASSSDGGETFEVASVVGDDEGSWPKVAADGNVYMAWTEGSDIMVVVAAK